MRILLDTHVFLWCIQNNQRIAKPTREKILRASEVYISSASIWEIMIEIGIKKLDADSDQIVDAIAESGFLELPITVNHTRMLAKLNDFHKDPFDRILIAQALSEPLTFLTADQQLKKYSELVEIIDD